MPDAERRPCLPCLPAVQPGGKSLDWPLVLPMLPFQAQEVMTPGMTKALHLYEPRYLEMLEEVLASGHRLMAHVVVEQPLTVAAARRPGAYVPASRDFVMCMATLVKVGGRREVPRSTRRRCTQSSPGAQRGSVVERASPPCCAAS